MLYYLPLESYPERYTFQLERWTTNRFQAQDVPYIKVVGDRLAGSEMIRKSVALDPAGRTYYGTTQIARLIELFESQPPTDEDIIYMQDMYQPGYDALPYIFSQLPKSQRPKIFTQNCAQSVDPHDFTFPFRHWMRHYELMVDETITGVFVASTVHKEMMQAAMFNAPIHVVGLPFDRYEVANRQPFVELDQRPKRVVFTSRFDKEKQPWFFIQFAEHIKKQTWGQEWEFAVCTGSKQLRSNDPRLLERAKSAVDNGIITLYEGLSKDQYYKILSTSRAHFNCALQDFISNTLNEASAFGVPSLVPAHLAFPEAVNNNHLQMYTPWSVQDAVNKFKELVKMPLQSWVYYPAVDNHATLTRVIDIMKKAVK